MDWVESQINNEDIFPIDKGIAKSTDAIISQGQSLPEAAWLMKLDM